MPFAASPRPLPPFLGFLFLLPHPPQSRSLQVDVGIIADVGTLQRLPGLVGERIAREWCLTGRHVPAEEAKTAGLVNETFATGSSLMEHARATAATIGQKSPVVVAGVKEVLLYARDNSVADRYGEWCSFFIHCIAA